jgi:hypothetical protein
MVPPEYPTVVVAGGQHPPTLVPLAEDESLARFSLCIK